MRGVLEATAFEDRIDANIERVERWMTKACDALLANWDGEAGNFWRDSFETKSDSTTRDDGALPTQLGAGKGTTSNNRAFQALLFGAAYLSGNSSDSRLSQLRVELSACSQRMLDQYFCAFDLELLRSHGENYQNNYSDCQLLLSLALALSPAARAICELELTVEQEGDLLDKMRSLTNVVLENLSSRGVSVDENANPHQFLTLHAVRAVDAAQRVLECLDRDALAEDRLTDYGGLLETVRNEIIHQLGLHLIPSPGFDSASLIACCALLSRFTREADSPLLRQCVDALASEQSVRGTWTTAGVIGFDRRRIVYVPSVELSLALADLVLQDLAEGDLDLFERALPTLENSLQLVQSSYTRHEERFGWRNDRTGSGRQVESWTTAVVLRFLGSFRTVLQTARQEIVLQRYRATRERNPFPPFWADLAQLVPSRDRQERIRTGVVEEARLAPLSGLCDPTAGNAVVRGILDDIVKPILVGPERRPKQVASFLLYGPPGTRKTSLVASLANTLNWPLIVLSPPAFLKQGIEGFEFVADQIFEDLTHLRRAVVLFDECEEFFRWRPPDPGDLESRTVGAFITSGMLPRLQRLRDERWVVFVINTNVEAFELDDAVTRRGRLDKVARLGYPVLDAQMRYLTSWRSRPGRQELSQSQLMWFESTLSDTEREISHTRDLIAKDRTKAQLENPDRGPEYRQLMSELARREARELTKVVTFSMLDDLASRCLGLGSASRIETADQLRTNLAQEFDRFGPDRWDRE